MPKLGNLPDDPPLFLRMVASAVGGLSGGIDALRIVGFFDGVPLPALQGLPSALLYAVIYLVSTAVTFFLYPWLFRQIREGLFDGKGPVFYTLLGTIFAFIAVLLAGLIYAVPSILHERFCIQCIMSGAGLAYSLAVICLPINIVLGPLFVWANLAAIKRLAV